MHKVVLRSTVFYLWVFLDLDRGVETSRQMGKWVEESPIHCHIRLFTPDVPFDLVSALSEASVRSMDPRNISRSAEWVGKHLFG